MPDSSVYLKDGVKKAGFSATRPVASHKQKKCGQIFYFDLPFRQIDNTDKL